MLGLFASERYVDEMGYSYWRTKKDGHLECGICTNGASLVAAQFSGAVMGFAQWENPTARFEDYDGHDFAVVGPFVVDYWLWAQLSYPVAVFDSRLPQARKQIAKLYGDPGRWKLVSPLPTQFHPSPFLCDSIPMHPLR